MPKDGFEKREELGNAYWEDPRWEEVKALREKDRQIEANGLVGKIQSDWGLE